MDENMLVHPGEVLKEEFLEPYGLSANQLAQALAVPTNRITSIINGRRNITADTAILLAHAFKTSPQFWMNLQDKYDLDVASSHISQDRIRRADAFAKELGRATPPARARPPSPTRRQWTPPPHRAR